MLNCQLFLHYKRKVNLFILLYFLAFLNHSIYAQSDYVLNKTIKWGKKDFYISENQRIESYVFDNALITSFPLPLPVFSEKIFSENNFDLSISIQNQVYEIADAGIFENIDFPDNTLLISRSSESDKTFYELLIFPFKKSEIKGQIQRLVSFDIVVKEKAVSDKKPEKNSNYRAANNSILSSGNWYKLRVNESGVYKIDYNFLKNIGIEPSTVNPKNIRIYGNGGGMLPMTNNVSRPEDLTENAIMVIGEDDNTFNSGDYILFFGQSAHRWVYDDNSKMYKHQFNYYSDYAYYFLTISNEAGLRISNQQSLSENANQTVNSYDFYAFHEKVLKTEVVEYVKSGRDWYGEEFNLTLNYKIPINVPDINLSFPVKFTSHLAGRSSVNSSFSVLADGKSFSQSIYPVNTSDYLANYSSPNESTFSFMPGNGNLEFNYIYNKPNSNSVGWLNFLRVNARSDLKINSGQYCFRDTSVVGKGISEIQINSSLPDINIWNVTNPLKPVYQQKNKSGNLFSFKQKFDKLTEFVVFANGGEKIPVFVEKIDNQNLHAVVDVDMIIISHPDYLNQAKTLADFRRKNDSLTVYVTTPNLIYNEFSSGAQDITAIRDFLRNVYKNNTDPDKQLKYVLLLGDASYDYRDVLNGNTNRIPTYQSPTIFSPISSYASDDYFGFLDDNEGNWDDIWATMNHDIDIAIGRLPVSTSQQASDVVNKIIHYYSTSSQGDWRNHILFVADDVDESGLNAHAEHSEYLANYLNSNVKNINLNKVYMDAYQQVSTSNGFKYPDAQKALNSIVDKGMFIVNYIGHGGEVGWAHERVLEVSDIKSWKNYDKLSIFITATCEFSRYDDPVRVSAGELVLLNPKGGASALLTTSRVVYVQANEDLTSNIYENNLFERVNGKHKRVGDVVVKAKNRTKFSDNTRKFILLGDPSMKMAIPDLIVKTDYAPDTFKALDKVTISGSIEDISGNKINTFNGKINTTIFDKPILMKTLDNDKVGKSINFWSMNNIIFKGTSSVNNGKFSFSFIVPKDISYAENKGKISYYAFNNTEDASGYYENFIVGGSTDSVYSDDKPPVVKVFIGDSNFISGGITGENPVLYVQVKDDNGINTVGNGIGHEILGFLNDGNPFVLNNYYQSKLNSYKEGEIWYPLSNLPEGKHSIMVKVWDVSNNSATGSVDFVVRKSEEFIISNIFTYPNPFTKSTVISFEHNMSETAIDVNIDIYSSKGELVKNIRESLQPGSSNRTTSIEWNPYQDAYNSIEPGLYIINIYLQTEDGLFTKGSGKTIYVR